MANPLSAAVFLAALKAEGVRVVERPGWSTYNRGLRGDGWGGVNGVVIHHTAGRDSLAVCINGILPDLPGPLCHTHLSKAGAATLVGYGRTNHAGTFAANAHAAVVAESSTHPRPDAAEPVDGNAHYYGVEIENLGNGSDPYPAVQYDQAVRWAAAICRAHGWSEHSVIGHKEGTRRKVDPSFDMDTFRADVSERLTHPASWNPNEEDDVALTADDINKIVAKIVAALPTPTAQAVLNLDGVIDAPWSTDPDNQTWALKSVLTHATKATLRTEKQLAAADATIAELVKTVGTLAAATADLDPAAIVAELTAAIEGITVRIDATP